MTRKKLSDITKKQLIDDIISYLYKYDAVSDVVLYAGNRRYVFTENTDCELYVHKAGPVYISSEKIDVTRYVKYSNPDTVTMTFEGELYRIINEYSNSHACREFRHIFKKYGCYYEQGYAWSLAVYII